MTRTHRILEEMAPPPRWAVRLVVAQCDSGDLWLPSRTRPDWWDRRLRLRNPLHWRFALLTAVTGWVAWIEAS